MKSSYKKIGNYIEKVDARNKDLKVNDLRGLSMTKEFRKSTSNIVGTDMSKYKIVKKTQFACDFMSVIRVFKLPVVLHLEDEPIIVSPAYTVFEIVDEEALLPEYLMMWMRRSEFDRYAFFKCDSAIRGGFAWEELCDVELPVPPIEKQWEIVREYHTITDRIKLNEQLNQKLEVTAQAIYKQWFVDFEFPVSKEYALGIGRPELEGKPYKSNGGEMVYSNELDQEIPQDWGGAIYENTINFRTGKLNSNAAVIDGEYPFFTCSAETFKTNTYAFDCEAVLLAGNNASAVYPLKFFRGKFNAYQRTYVVQPKNKRLSNEQIYFALKNELEGFKGTSSGTTTKFLTKGILNNLKIVLPPEDYTVKFKNLVCSLFSYQLVLTNSSEKLLNAQSIILSKMTKLESATQPQSMR